MKKNIELSLPPWCSTFFEKEQVNYEDDESKMEVVINLALQNITHQTGGPFAAAIFNAKTNHILSIGVNVVVPQTCSVAHAEMMAIMLAQYELKEYDLSAQGENYELFSSTEPCAMCLGAIPWSGLRRVVCGARDEDARSIGFDEGSKPESWEQSLIDRGIQVKKDVLRQSAQDVFAKYRTLGGKIYNSGESI